MPDAPATSGNARNLLAYASNQPSGLVFYSTSYAISLCHLLVSVNNSCGLIPVLTNLCASSTF